eukprot:scaffold2684_cov341-Prasinococcus_capsulatus_cf.AAC.1
MRLKDTSPARAPHVCTLVRERAKAGEARRCDATRAALSNEQPRARTGTGPLPTRCEPAGASERSLTALASGRGLWCARSWTGCADCVE